MYISQMFAIDIYVLLKCVSSNNFINTIGKYPIGLVFFVGIFNVIRVALITGPLQTTDLRNLRKTWVSYAPRHVSD